MLNPTLSMYLSFHTYFYFTEAVHLRSFSCIIAGWNHDESERSSFDPRCREPCVWPVQSKEVGGTEHTAACCSAVKIRPALAYPG